MINVNVHGASGADAFVVAREDGQAFVALRINHEAGDVSIFPVERAFLDLLAGAVADAQAKSAEVGR